MAWSQAPTAPAGGSGGTQANRPCPRRWEVRTAKGGSEVRVRTAIVRPLALHCRTLRSRQGVVQLRRYERKTSVPSTAPCRSCHTCEDLRSRALSLRGAVYYYQHYATALSDKRVCSLLQCQQAGGLVQEGRHLAGQHLTADGACQFLEETDDGTSRKHNLDQLQHLEFRCIRKSTRFQAKCKPSVGLLEHCNSQSTCIQII